MRKFKRAAVVAASVLAFGGAAAGVSQAATEHQTETPGNAATDCHTAETQQELQMGANGGKVVIDSCDQESGPGTPTMMIHWHYA